MPRRLIQLAAAVLLPLSASIWPEQIWAHKRTSRAPIQVADLPLWTEYSLEEAESAVYDGPGGTMRVSGYRLKDPTAALGVYQWTRPAEGAPAKLWKTGIQTPERAYLLVGNYVLDLQGRLLPEDEFAKLYVQLPNLDQSSLPSLPSFLPRDGLVPGTMRYILGPVGLEKFYPGVTPSTAAFSLGAEVQTGKFRAGNGTADLALFNYPTPQMAREKLAGFQNIAGGVAKRAGPIVAICLNAPNADEAEKLLAKVSYQATVTWNEPVKKEEKVGEFLVNLFIFIGLLLLATVGAGLVWYAARQGYRKATGRTGEESVMTRLEIDKAP